MTAADEIRNLVYAYSWHVDRGDFAAVGRLFEHAAYDASAVSGVVATGAEEVGRMFATNVRLHGDGRPETIHLNPNVTVEIEGDSARARTTFVVLQATADFPLQLILAGHYDDEFARLDEAWRWSRRTAYVHLTGDLSRHVRVPIVTSPV